MKDSFVLGTAAVAIACCFGVSLLATVGATTLLSVAGVALPVAAAVGIGGGAFWFRTRRAHQR